MRGAGAAAWGAALYLAIYVAVAAQQFTRYAYPAGMDLTIAGVVPADVIGILVRALLPVLVATNAIVAGFQAAAGALLGWLAARFWRAVLGPRTPRGWRLLLLATLTLGLVAVLAFAVIAGRYPFQHDHWLNARGGAPRALQELLALRVPELALDGALWGTLALLALPTAWVAVSRLARAARARPRAAAALGALAVLAGAWGAWPASPGAVNTGPNVVVILLESARGDFFSVNGYPEPTSPGLARLVAERGTTFRSAWAHANGTVESAVTVLTGLYAHRHGMRTMFHHEGFAGERLATLPALLRARGWTTRVATDWAGDITFFNPRALPGFDIYDAAEFGVVNYVKQVYAQHFLFHALTDHPLGHRAFSTFYHASGGFARAGSDAPYLARIERHLAELARTPRFALTLFLSNAHFPYRCGRPWHARFTDPAYRGGSRYQAMANPLQADTRGMEIETRQIRGLYAGCVAAFDDNVAQIDAMLQRLGLADRTVVVVTGDHGEKLPDTATFHYGRNGAWLDPAEFRVPLVVLAPKLAVAMRAVDATVRHVDVVPTVLELVGVPAPQGLDGTSLVPLMTGARSDLGLDVYGETTFHWSPVDPPYLGYPPMTEVVRLHVDARGRLIPRYFIREDCLVRIDVARHRFLRRGPWQLNYRPTEDGRVIELHDWRRDPGGQVNVAAAFPAITRDLERSLLAWSLEDEKLALRGGRLVARTPGAGDGCAPRGRR